MSSKTDYPPRERAEFLCDTAGSILSVHVRGDGFLYNMVRIIVGTLIAVSAGKIAPEEIPAILASGNRTLAGMTAPPEGLHLATLFYPAGILPTE